VSENEREREREIGEFLALKLYCPGVTPYIGSAKVISEKKGKGLRLEYRSTNRQILLVFQRTMKISARSL
jgi:hypothetical protein